LKLNHSIMLITYADSFGGSLSEIDRLLNLHYEGAIGGVHLLPPFPYSADRGFSPITYNDILPSYGTWTDVEKLSKKYYLMLDFMINHISAESPQYQDFLKNKDTSLFKSMFIRYNDFWQDGEPTQAQVDAIYKRKPRAPYVNAVFPDGTQEKVWCTFGTDQIDLNVQDEDVRQYIRNTLNMLMEHGMSLLRLDAFAYCIKKAGSSCFFVEPETWKLLSDIQDMLKHNNCAMLPEIHEHYSIQLKLADKGYWTYDFAMPMLVLYALFSGDGEPLKHWLKICPRKQFTTLDTHDGIGVVDARDLLTTEQIDLTSRTLYEEGANVSRIYSSEAYNNLDIYQINCTYYSALGNNDNAYLLARAIQFFAPGIPQVYYVGMLAGENDIELVEKTCNGRDINRHNYTTAEVDAAMNRSVVIKLRALMRLRNQSKAFEGECTVEDTNASQLRISRTFGGETLVLDANLKAHAFIINKILSDNELDEQKSICIFDSTCGDVN
jgi:sucrose phosphorylase